MTEEGLTTTVFTVNSKTELSNYLLSALVWLVRGWDEIKGWDRLSRVSIAEGSDFDSKEMIVTTIILVTPAPPDSDLLSAVRFLITGSCPRIGEVIVPAPAALPAPVQE